MVKAAGTVEFRKAQVVADGQAEGGPFPADRNEFLPRPDVLRLTVTRPIRQGDVEQVNLVVDRRGVPLPVEKNAGVVRPPVRFVGGLDQEAPSQDVDRLFPGEGLERPEDLSVQVLRHMSTFLVRSHEGEVLRQGDHVRPAVGSLPDPLGRSAQVVREVIRGTHLNGR